MNREETKKLLTIIGATWENFHPEDKTATIDAWTFFLADHDFKEIMLALKTFVDMGGSNGFAPKPEQLIAMSRKPQELAVMEEGEAWALVDSAIRKSGYYAEEEFQKLKEANPMIAKVIGSSSQLHAWATDENYNASVVSSNFMRAYRSVVSRTQEEAHLPLEAKKKLAELTGTALRIGVSEDGQNGCI